MVIQPFQNDWFTAFGIAARGAKVKKLTIRWKYVFTEVSTG
jgi:hypothetical protein